jgi:ABC-type amino acid transport substrate-binding protein
MFPDRFVLKLCGFWLALSCASPAMAADIVMRPRPDDAKGPRVDFNGLVIEEALRRTVPTWGPYEYAPQVPLLARERMLDEMLRGEVVNLSVVASQPAWEERLLPIRIPIDMGLSGYRIALIHRDNQARLAAVKDVAELKRLGMGVGTAWSSRKVFEAEGFRTVTGESFNALLQMLMAGRSDYFLRGLNEAFPEHAARKDEFPALAIEQQLLLVVPLPTYIFVSPKAPRLAKRLEEGMESMLRDGTLQKLVLQHHSDLLAQAQVCSRRIFRINNPLLAEPSPARRKELWLDPFAPGGLCSRQSGARH